MKKNSNKRVLLLSLAALLFSSNFLFAQEADDKDPKNQVKWNVAALAVKSFSFQFERAIGSKMSAAVTFRTVPKGSIPFESSFENLVDDPETWDNIKGFETGNFAITPEVRFYLGEKVFKGFYVAPFVSYASYSVDVPFGYDVSGSRKEMPLTGDITSFGGGVFLGAQWSLGKSFSLDAFVGPNYSSASGDLVGTRTLSTQEQDGLREGLEDLDLPFLDTKSTVSGTGAKIDFDGSLPGIKAGISIGFKF